MCEGPLRPGLTVARAHWGPGISRTPRRDAIQADPHRDALRQPYPGKGRVDADHQIAVRLPLAIGDAAGI